MKISLSCLRWSLVCTLFLSNSLSSFSQIPLTGFEIEGILVDGCDGGNEGKNEMVTFRNGPVALDIDDIRVDGAGATGVINSGQWPSNNFLGWCTTAGATANIATLDAAITTTCGKLLEPPGGIIPAGGKVLIITSTDFTAVSTYFENLTDTLYVVLQCAGNTGGHFANYNATSSTRILVLTNTVTGFADTIAYDRSLLLNSGGTPGSGDGAAVSYAWDGTPTYFNNGCQAPFIALSVSIDPISNADCLTNTFTMSGNVMSGNYKDIIWTSTGTGTFSAANTLNTDYTPGFGELGIVTISFKAVDFCDDTTTTTQNITVSPIAVADGGNDVSICSGSSEGLGTASAVGFTYVWNATTGLDFSTISDPTITLTNLTASPVTSTYTVTSTVTATGCSATDDVDVTVVPLDNSTFTTTPTCAGGTVTITGTTGGTFTFTIPPSDGASIHAATGSITGGSANTTYTITYITSGLCNATATNSVTSLSIPNAPINHSADTSYCSNEIPSDLVAVATAGGTITWYSDVTLQSIISTDSIVTPSSSVGSTTYYVTETVNECESASNQVTITISSCDIIIPTAFTPNTDGSNDVWELTNIDSTFPENVVRIYNRWGNLLFESPAGKYETLSWDGRYNGELLPVSSYYFIIDYNVENKDAAHGTISILK